MKIRTITTSGLRSVPDRTFSLTGDAAVPFDVVVVTGPPSSGKTTFLDAIAAHKEVVSPYGAPPPARDLIRPGGTTAKISVEWWLDPAELDTAGLKGPSTSETVFKRQGLHGSDADPGLLAVLERYSHYTGIGKIDYFPDDRGLPLHGALVSDVVLDQRFQRLTRGPGKYASLVRFVRNMLLGTDDQSRLEPLKQLFHALCPWRTLASVNGVGMPVFHATNGLETPLDKLSGAEQQAFLFAATVVMVGLFDSVVLIDTLELRLAPGEAARVLAALKAYAPTNQWIVATTDPEIVASVPAPACIRLGDGRS
ncbi:MAG: ATP-binding protein [Myxococcales bacterium]|nr:ATP-binding protein [Myxococcales bacterium]